MARFRLGMAVIPRSLTGTVAAAALAERSGFDVVWLGDTLGDWIDPAQPFLDPWPLFGLLAERTDRIALGALVTNVAWRSPVQIARWAMTVDHISGGRFELGVGCGFVDDQRMAGPDTVAMTGAERVARLDDGLQVIDQLLRGDLSAYQGKFTSYDVAAMAPGCVQTPRAPLIVAGVGERVMRVAARWADRWNTFVDTPTVDDFLPVAKRRLARLDELCQLQGREPGTLGRGVTLFFEAVDTWADPSGLVRLIEEYTSIGFDEFVLYPPRREQLPAFEVAMDKLRQIKQG